MLSLSLESSTDIQKDEIYEFLIASKRNSVDKKHFKKVFEIFQTILKYKGDMVRGIVSIISDLYILLTIT